MFQQSQIESLSVRKLFYYIFAQMVLIFKSQRTILIVVLAMLAFIVKGLYILEPSTMHVETNNFLGDLFIRGLPNISLKGQYILATLIILAQATFINWMVRKFELLERYSWLPAFCFVLLTSALPQTNQLSPQLIANFLVLAAIWKLFVLYKSETSNKHLFELGAICSFAFLIRFELIYMLPVMLYMMGILRVPNFREMLLILLGFITPIYILASLLYIFKIQDEILVLLSRNIYKVNELSFGDYYSWIPLSLLFLMYLAGAVIMQENIHKSMLRIRKMLRIIVILFPVTVAIAFSDYENLNYNLIYMMAPTSVLIANYLIQPKWYWVKELMVTIVIAGEIYLPLMLKYPIKF